MSLPRFYLTTAIDYSNGAPHIGHAFEKIGADAIARYHRSRGHAVHFLIGMDEHGHKVAQSAAERGIPPQQLVDELAGVAGPLSEDLEDLSHVHGSRFALSVGYRVKKNTSERDPGKQSLPIGRPSMTVIK